ncbi:MAG: PDZ domain-containing protein [Chloroflexi bacterium]|nr:PDZ domain-containing protein [Chloroflexota bacterium]
MQVTVYTTPSCPYCAQARAFLQQRGIPFAEKDVSTDTAAAIEMVRKSGQQGVPVITVDDQVVVGFDRPRLERLLADRARGRPSVGLSIADASRITMRTGGVPVFGAFVGRVAPGSPGERAGLRPGDIVVEANLRPIANADQFEQALNGVGAGGRAPVAFLRGDKRLHAELRF